MNHGQFKVTLTIWISMPDLKSLTPVTGSEVPANLLAMSDDRRDLLERNTNAALTFLVGDIFQG